MLINFSEEEKELLLSLGIDPLQEFLSDNTAEACEVVSNYLQLHGITSSDELNSIGLICEDIMWKLAKV